MIMLRIVSVKYQPMPAMPKVSLNVKIKCVATTSKIC